MTKTTWLGCMVALSTLPLMGCGAAKSIINSNLPAVNDMLKLDGQTLVTTMGDGRAVISGNKTVTVTVPNRSISQADQLAALTFAQSLEHQVTVSVPAGATMPTSFPISNVALSLQIREGSGSSAQLVELLATVAGPITFTRTSPTSNLYEATSPVEFSHNATGTTLFQVLGIITGGADPNTVVARLSVDSDDTKLPSGSTLTFRFYNGSAKPKL